LGMKHLFLSVKKKGFFESFPSLNL